MKEASSGLQLDDALSTIVDRIGGQRFTREQILEAMILITQDDAITRMKVLELAWEIAEEHPQVRMGDFMRP